MHPDWWLLPVGVILGTFGTLIGAGGGFLLVPLLILLYPAERAETITSISLAVVFFNALSGSWAYARMKRIDYASGLLFASATIPGAVIGAFTTAYIPRRTFDSVFGVLLIGVALALLATSSVRPTGRGRGDAGRMVRTLTEADGSRHTFSYNPAVGIGLSLVVGFVSSLLGIGGGIIHVPALVYLLGFPPHIATATSHFILVFMALAGTTVHVATGALTGTALPTALLSAGVLAGAQVGARLSRQTGKPS